MNAFRFLAALLLTLTTFLSVQADDKTDIVLIVVDDLNDYLGCLGGHPDSKSPNIDALAASGMLFKQAYCNAPQCKPSRGSFNSGIYPFNSGLYFNASGKGAKGKKSKAKGAGQQAKTPTIQQFFQQQGYFVVSAGKVHHSGPGKDGDALLGRPKDPRPPKGHDKFGALNPPSDGYALDAKDQEMGDYKVASFAIDQWQKVKAKPLFMSIGFYRPHRPLQVPKPYFDLFPLDKIKRPAEPEGVDDWQDMPAFAQKLARSHAHKDMHKGLSDHEHIVKYDEWDKTLQAYHASVTFVDKQIGRLVDALKENPRGHQTVIMLVSDHGWHLGEKKHWCKGAIWEQTTRIPFIVSAPGVKPGAICMQPVSLIDVYPSLVDLAGIVVPNFLDGKTVGPQLKNPSMKRNPVISSYGHGNTAIRSERYRYIHYEDGSEELYDHKSDPNEWTNLAKNPEYANIIKEHAAHIPKNQVTGTLIQTWFDKYQ